MESLNDLWTLVRDEIKANISEAIFQVWLCDLNLESFDGTTAVISTDSFRRKIVEQKFIGDIAAAFEKTTGLPVEIQLVDVAEAAPAPTESAVGKDDDDDEANTFETFVVGPSNRFANAAAVAVAAKPGTDNQYNPLFIWGNSGLGKTHLMCAIGHEIHKRSPEKEIVYVRCDDLINMIIDGMLNHKMQAVRDKFRNADVLLVDDVQFLRGKDSTQEEFFFIFEALHSAGKQIVLTSDRPPRDIPELVDRLRGRFESGLTADIQPPDLETRIAIINRKATVLDLEIRPEVVLYIAENIKNNVRQLEGAIKKMKAIITFNGGSANMATAQIAIKDILADVTPIPVTVEKIINEVARVYGGNPADIRSKKKDAQSSSMRQIAMYTVREMTHLSSNEIGAEFGGRDHSTVLYALNNMESKIKKDPALQKTINDIIKNVEDK